MTILNQLLEALTTDERLVIDGKLAKNKIVELALNLDPTLLKILLNNEQLKDYFFTDVEGVLIFDKVAFQRFVNNKSFLPDSFTQFKNKIGLSADNHYLADTNDIVLSWPYKDCVLEGGQTEDDEKRSEVFWNETLAPEQVDCLLTPKVLTNFERHDADGAHEVNHIGLDDNLIIKGNNLLALHSLKKRYAGKLKLIYIDPPYNTGSDSFGYNDNFNHSTWLTFIKNRLEVAKELLSDDGSIWINIDDVEAHYLKVLCDGIFDRSNFVGNVVWEKVYTPKNNGRAISSDHDHILIYAKSEQWFSNGWNLVPRSEEQKGRFTNTDNDPNGPWRTYPMDVRTENGAKREKYRYEVILPSGRKVKPATGRHWALPLESFEKSRANNEIYFGKTGDAMPTTKVYLKDAKQGVIARSWWPYKEVGGNQDAKREILSLLGDSGFITPKPEKLLERIIQIGTNKGDFVLDFFAGSGTTASVAHKMGRKFITCEQMDYVNDVTRTRLIKVLEGEQGGVSKNVKWQGGGSFVYIELAECASKYINRIEAAKTTNNLIDIWDELKTSNNLSYKIKPSLIDNKISDFSQLSLEEQKQFLIEIIDKNQLYVNFSDIDDETNGISEQDKKLNQQFYGA